LFCVGQIASQPASLVSIFVFRGGRVVLFVYRGSFVNLRASEVVTVFTSLAVVVRETWLSHITFFEKGLIPFSVLR